MQSLRVVDAPSDETLIASVRQGDTDAYAVLYLRHVEAARRLAGQLANPAEADDLVAESFSRLLNHLQDGAGPEVAFRAYLLTTLRRLHVDRLRQLGRAAPTGDERVLDTPVMFTDTVVAAFESSVAARAFASLPERWQTVLWHTEVDGQRPADLAPQLGMSPNSVSALAVRAREGLRQAFLAEHAGAAQEIDCRHTREQLGFFIRTNRSPRRRRRERVDVAAHLEQCRPCSGIYLDLVDVNARIGALLAPAVLGPAAASYVAAGLTGSHLLGGAAVAGSAPASMVLDRARDLVVDNLTTKAAAGVTAVAVTGGVLAGLPSGGLPDLDRPTSRHSITADGTPFGGGRLILSGGELQRASAQLGLEPSSAGDRVQRIAGTEISRVGGAKTSSGSGSGGGSRPGPRVRTVEVLGITTVEVLPGSGSGGGTTSGGSGSSAGTGSSGSTGANGGGTGSKSDGTSGGGSGSGTVTTGAQDSSDADAQQETSKAEAKAAKKAEKDAAKAAKKAAKAEAKAQKKAAKDAAKAAKKAEKAAAKEAKKAAKAEAKAQKKAAKEAAKAAKKAEKAAAKAAKKAAKAEAKAQKKAAKEAAKAAKKDKKPKHKK